MTNRTQFSVNRLKGIEIRKLDMSFAPQWSHANQPVCNPNMIEWHWGTLHQKLQINTRIAESELQSQGIGVFGWSRI